MNVLSEFLTKINDENHREITENVLSWVKDKYPQLEPVMKWNQPMFTNEGTFIIAFSVAKQHLAVAPESVAIDYFKDDFEKVGYVYTKELFRIPWTSKVDYDLLGKIIEYNMEEKKGYTSFWRK